MIGYAAAALTTSAFIPQVVKSWRSRSTGDLSAVMLVVFTAGIVLWLLYGLALGSLPVVLANGVTLVLSATLVALKLLGSR
jgi:MtN3 and saliva related transmembrane protein